MVTQGKNTVFAHLKHLQDHNETGYLKQALEFIKANREEMPFTVAEVHELLHEKTQQKSSNNPVSGGCPGSAPAAFSAAGLTMAQPKEEMASALTHWPVQLHLINPAASYFHGADLLIAADCTAFAHGDFHRKFVAGKKMVIACPKLDQGKEIYIQKFVRLINEAKVNTITVAIMEVPCCGGLIGMVQTALSYAERNVPVKVVVISTQGQILSEDWIPMTQTV